MIKVEKFDRIIEHVDYEYCILDRLEISGGIEKWKTMENPLAFLWLLNGGR